MVTVPFAYSYSRTYFPHAGGGKINGSSATMSAEFSGELRRVEAGDAPIAARLDTPDEVEFEVRVVDGKFMRPVRPPGANTPCTIEEFIDAARGTSPWRDSPFHDRTYAGGKASAALEGAGTIDDHERKYSIRKWAPEDRRDGALRKCLDTLSTLVVIGDIVYTPCAPPILEIRRKDNHGKKPDDLALAWTDDDEFDFHAHPDTGPGRVNSYDAKIDNDLFRPIFGKPPREVSYDSGSNAAELAIARFPLHRHADALRFMEVLGEASRLIVDTTPVVNYADPDLLPPLAKSLPSFLKTIIKGFRNPKYVWDEVMNAPRPVVDAWMESRDTFKSLGDVPTAEAVREAFEKVCDVAWLLQDGATDERKKAEKPEMRLSLGSETTRIQAILMRWKTADCQLDVTDELAIDERLPEADADAIANAF